MMNLPNFFDVNVTASSTMSIGVVRHKMYLTSFLKISESNQKCKYRKQSESLQAGGTIKYWKAKSTDSNQRQLEHYSPTFK